jgi:hypothetical protein
VRFKLMRADGARVRQQYVSDAPTDEPCGAGSCDAERFEALFTASRS